MLQSKLATLSFVKSSQTGVDLWPETESSGSYESDNEIGRSRGEELIHYMRNNQAPMVLGHVSKRIAERGVFGAMEVGFFNHLALFAMKGLS